MPNRSDAELVKLHAALRKKAFEETGPSLVREALAEGKTAASDPTWTIARAKHASTP